MIEQLKKTIRKRESENNKTVVVKKKKKKKRKRCQKKNLTPGRVIRAMRNTGGNIKYIADKLDRPYSTVYKYIKKQPLGSKLSIALAEEKEFITDVAEKTVLELMGQRVDFSEAGRNARFVLQHHEKGQERGYKDKKEVTLQGGDAPIRMESKNLIGIQELKCLSLKDRKKLLKEIEQKQLEESKE